MKKYLLIIRNTWDEYFVYRLNFILWRVRVVLRFIITYFLWSAIFPGTESFFGYNRSLMLTYIFVVYLVSNFIFATRTQEVGAEINEGKLTNYLLRPVNYFLYLGAKEISDKLLNFFFTISETLILIFILRPPLFLQTDPKLISLFILAFLASIIIYFCISLLLSFLGFWTTEIWASRFIFIILLDFLAGNFFPIDILPKFLYQILLLTPFPYMFYFPAKIYSGNLSTIELTQGFIILSVWSLVLIKSVELVWKRGLKIYSAEGR